MPVLHQKSGDSRFRGNGERGGEMGKGAGMERGAGMGRFLFLGRGNGGIGGGMGERREREDGGVRMREQTQKLNYFPFPRKRESPDFWCGQRPH